MGLFSWFQERLSKKQERKNQKLLNAGPEMPKPQKEYDDSEALYEEIGVMYDEVLKNGEPRIRTAISPDNTVAYYATWEWTSDDDKRNHVILGELPSRDRQISISKVATQINKMMEYKYKQVTEEKKIVKIQEKEAYLHEMYSLERNGDIVFGKDGRKFLEIDEAGPTIIKKAQFIPFTSENGRTQVQKTKTLEERLGGKKLNEGSLQEKYAPYTIEQKEVAMSIVLLEQDKKGKEEIEEGKLATKVILAVNAAKPEELSTLLRKNEIYFLTIMKTQRYDIYERYRQPNDSEEKENILKGMLEYAKDTYIQTHEKAIRTYTQYVESHHLEEPIYKLAPVEKKEEEQRLKGEGERS